jgi:hypothetical protein
MARAGLDYVVDCPPVGRPVLLDRDAWEKVVLNLLSNALKFTASGRVSVRVEATADAAVLRGEDTGVGVPADELPRLFERFHRVRGARSRSHEGSGIGLALVCELAELHGGTVSVASKAGEGSTFRIELPVRQQGTRAAPVADPDRAARRDGFSQEALRWLEGERIVPAAPAEGRPEVLVVDDNADLRLYLSRLLEEHYAIRTAADGADALEQIA